MDAGLASLASFVTGLYVVRIWAQEPDKIGVYGLFFAAMGIATTVTTQWVCVPAEKAALDLPGLTRRRLAPAIALKLSPVALLGGLAVAAPALWVLAGGRYDQLVGPLTVTAFVAFVVSPLQDHVRRLLHMDAASWMAALVSAVQLGAACVALLWLHLLVGDPAWAAFGALALANIASLGAGLVLARVTGRPADDGATAAFMAAVRFSVLSRSGRWLGTAGLLSTATNLLVSAIVAAVAGEAALGYSEAARTIAQPVVVVSMGLRAIFGPGSMEHAKARDRAGAVRISNLFMLVLWPLTLLFIGLFGFAWSLNPFVALAPAAYVVSGLVAVSVVANGLNGAAFPLRLELVGADRERALFSTDALSNLLMLGASTLMAVIGADVLMVAAMARPAGMAVLGLARWILYRMAVWSHYTDVPRLVVRA